jgi:hypothetical protein
MVLGKILVLQFAEAGDRFGGQREGDRRKAVRKHKRESHQTFKDPDPLSDILSLSSVAGWFEAPDRLSSGVRELIQHSADKTRAAVAHEQTTRGNGEQCDKMLVRPGG